jgi:hypothetical protein
MAEQGVLRGFLDFLKDPKFDTKDNNEVSPPDDSSKPMHITPEAAIKRRNDASDPNVIYDDSGKAVDYDTGDPISRALKGIVKSREHGLLRDFMERMISPTRERNNAGLEGGMARVDELTGMPSKNVTPTELKPVLDYKMTSIAPQSIQELRKSLYEQAGQGAPPLAAVNNDPNSLAGRMQSPNYEAEKRSQMNDAQNISDRFTTQPRANKKSITNPFSTLFTGRQT